MTNIITKASHIFYSRFFLNSIESNHSGSMKIELNTSRSRRKSKTKKQPLNYFTIRGHIEIRDCFKRIDLSLDGGTYTKKKYIKLLNTEAKLIKIVKSCLKMLEVIEEIKERDSFYLEKATEEIKLLDPEYDLLMSEEMPLPKKPL